MDSCLRLIHLSQTHHFLYERMVFCHLYDLPVHLVQAAVSDICDIQAVPCDSGSHKRSPHPPQARVCGRQRQKPGICLAQCCPKQRNRPGQSAACDCLNYMLYRIPRSEVSCIMTAHPVCNDKKIRKISNRSLGRIDIILVHFTTHSYICHGKCFHLIRLPFTPFLPVSPDISFVAAHMRRRYRGQVLFL